MRWESQRPGLENSHNSKPPIPGVCRQENAIAHELENPWAMCVRFL